MNHRGNAMNLPLVIFIKLVVKSRRPIIRSAEKWSVISRTPGENVFHPKRKEGESTTGGFSIEELCRNWNELATFHHYCSFVKRTLLYKFSLVHENRVYLSSVSLFSFLYSSLWKEPGGGCLPRDRVVSVVNRNLWPRLFPRWDGASIFKRAPRASWHSAGKIGHWIAELRNEGCETGRFSKCETAINWTL